MEGGSDEWNEMIDIKLCSAFAGKLLLPIIFFLNRKRENEVHGLDLFFLKIPPHAIQRQRQREGLDK